ncbi:MAG: hypothetical protein AAF512_12045, partial [Pseudomonadota bacterium]
DPNMEYFWLPGESYLLRKQSWLYTGDEHEARHNDYFVHHDLQLIDFEGNIVADVPVIPSEKFPIPDEPPPIEKRNIFPYTNFDFNIIGISRDLLIVSGGYNRREEDQNPWASSESDSFTYVYAKMKRGPAEKEFPAFVTPKH